jgi:hypothetical protein
VEMIGHDDDSVERKRAPRAHMAKCAAQRIDRLGEPTRAAVGQVDRKKRKCRQGRNYAGNRSRRA